MGKGNIIRKVDNCVDALRRLGFKASDLLQTDGVIWVEGPSDRLYIEYWLKKWCLKHKKSRPAENIDYSYSFYGGSILSHFKADGKGYGDLIDILKINTNAFMVIDNDNDFILDKNNNLKPVRKGSSKYRVSEKINELGGGVWITKGYTMESYLVEEYRKKHFKFVKGKLVLKKGHRKVTIAEEYEAQAYSDSQLLEIDDLELNIANIYKYIMKWSSY